MKRLTIFTALAFTLSVLLGLIGGQRTQADEPQAKFPKEPAVVFKELVHSGLNVGASAQILINHVESATGVVIPKHYHAGDEFVYYEPFNSPLLARNPLQSSII